MKQISTCSLWRNLQWAVSTINEVAAHGNPPTQTGSYQETRLMERSPNHCRFSERNCGFHIGAVCSSRSLNSITWKKLIMKLLLKHCSPGEGMLEQFGRDCIPLEGPHTVAGYQCEEERPTGMKPHELTSTHFLQPPEICEGKRKRSQEEN